MLPVEIVDRVFQIALSDAIGTAFSLDVDDRQYLVTARHMVQNIDRPTTIQIYHSESKHIIQIRANTSKSIKSI